MKRAWIAIAILLPGCFQAVSDQFGASRGATSATSAGAGSSSTAGSTASSSTTTSSTASSSTASGGSSGFNSTGRTSGNGAGSSTATSASSGTSGSGTSTASSSGTSAASSTSGTGSTGAVFNAGATTGYGNWNGIQSCADGTSNPLFLPPTAFPVAAAGNNIPGGRLGEVTGDGRLDAVLATEDNWGGKLVTLRNVGNGLAALSALDLGFYPESLRMQDVSGDGVPDAIVLGHAGSGGSGQIAVLVSDGHGDWRGPTTYAVGHQTPAIAFADVNGDGAPDLLATPDSSPSVSVYLNQGDGSFGIPATYATHANATELLAAKLSGALPDVVVTMPTTGVDVLHNDGAGGFGPATTLVSVTNGNPVVRTLVGDLNGDGNLDVVVVRALEFDLFRGDGAGGFTTLGGALSSRPSDALLADFNEDGRDDLALMIPAGSQAAKVRLLLSGSTGETVEATVCDSPIFPVAADVNGDGHLDLLYVYENKADLGMALGDGAGGLTVGDAFTNAYAAAFSLGDLNGDGRLDVLTTSDLDGQINVLLGR